MARGLSTDELTVIRDGLAAGRKPRVQFTDTAGQIAGQIGQVVSLADPAVSDEWVVVRFGRDELPFSPVDLQVPAKGAAARRPVEPPPQPAPRVEPEFVIDKPLPEPKVSEPAKTETGVGAPAPRKGGDDVDVEVAAPRKAAARPVKAKPAAALTVTLAYGEGEWTVAAAQGSKVLAKPYVVRPSEALRMVSLVDVPGVHEAVEQILSAERAEAEKQAERLRAELAEVEARLAELGEAS